jgi:hypothetical protein
MSLVDFGDLDLEQGQKPTVMEAGTECKLRIVSVNKGVNKHGNDYLQPRFEVVDEPLVKEFTHYMDIPNRNMEEKKLNNTRYGMSSFCQAFGIDASGEYDPVDVWPGHEGWAILGVSDNEEFGEQNYVRKVLPPK